MSKANLRAAILAASTRFAHDIADALEASLTAPNDAPQEPSPPKKAARPNPPVDATAFSQEALDAARRGLRGNMVQRGRR